MSVNKVILIGRLGSDPELRYTPTQIPVCDFSMATSEKWGQGAERKEKTEWHKIIIWGKAGEACHKYLKKGRQVFIEGKIQTRQYDKDGTTRYVTEIRAERVDFIGGKDEGGQSGTSGAGYSGNSNDGSGMPE